MTKKQSQTVSVRLSSQAMEIVRKIQGEAESKTGFLPSQAQVINKLILAGAVK